MKKMLKVLLLVGVVICASTIARADLINFTITLTGFQETPSNLSPAAGGGIATYDTIANTINVSVFFTGLAAPATASHIHVGPPGTPGGVIVSFVPFTPATTFGSIVGAGLAFPAANVPALLAGNTYFNIHDAVFPGGEIRGQLVPVTVPEPSTLAFVGLGVAAFLALRRRS